MYVRKICKGQNNTVTHKKRRVWISNELGRRELNLHCLSTEFSQSLPPCRSWRASARLHPYAPKFFAKIQPNRCSQFHISNFFCNKVNYAGNTVVFSRDLLPLRGKLLCETNVGSSSRCLGKSELWRGKCNCVLPALLDGFYLVFKTNFGY